MADVIFSAFNARYAHTSFGARYLLANMGELKERSRLIEFDLQVQPRIAVEKILRHEPKVVCIGCYIWNIDLVTKVAALLKAVRPEVQLVLGGPEISYETEEQEIFPHADYVVCGEGEIEVPKLCQQILSQRRKDAKKENLAVCNLGDFAPLRETKTIHAEPVDVTQIELPYDLYSDQDIKHRAIYVEASRGCPFRCEYCMSSLDPCVRYFPEEKLFPAFGRLLDRGALNFKFVDRTFNIDIQFALKVLAFFKERYQPGMMLHFEVIPSHLPDELMDAVKDCPPGMLQFEVGIQTFNETVAHRIQRPLDIPKIEANMRRLRNETGVHIHSDLIAGLPGEDLESFEAGFNRLLALNPQEIQLGILKRLRGAPIDRHSKDWKMVYSAHAPYEILSTSQISFEDMQRVQRFARYWNLVVNNGQFISTAPLLWEQGRQDVGDTPVPPAPVPPASSRLLETIGFNPHQEVRQSQRKNYPHWTQEGCTYFITFRLADSIPQSRIKAYEELRRKWEEHHHPPYLEQERERFKALFSERVNDWLDEGAGSCCLRDPEISKAVADTLLHFNGERYELDEWVIMPNHVHVLVKPLGDHQLSDILHSWKSFSAHEVNKGQARTGQLWQKESYDHIVRDLEELNRIRDYIRRNPEKAGIRVCHAGSRRDACDTSPSVPQASRLPSSAFAAFMKFSDWLYAKTDTTGNLHMIRLAKLLMEFQTLELGLDEKVVAEALWTDYQRGNRPDMPGFLKKFGFEKRDTGAAKPSTPMARQNRHLQE
ncbi:DUF4080 domain-containing protein [Pontiellaceae bacterium B12227]|nr:DUF4080 domain-containing protein [Pontiellaceae bacterium B12227]